MTDVLQAEKTRPEVRPERDGFTYIYFMGTEDGREVKFGKADNPFKRRPQNEAANGRREPLKILAVVKGVSADEDLLISYFAGKSSRPHSKEWITADDEVRTYLRFLRDQPYVLFEVERNDLTMVDLTAIQKVPSSEWLPKDGRGKTPGQLSLSISDDPWGDLATARVMEGDFYTHPTIIAAARDAMCGIDLDPASCKEANLTVGATRFIGEIDNGLLHPWAGRVWCNPPYGDWKTWAPKIVEELGNVEQLCLLVTTRSITGKTFHPLVQGADSIWIGRGRFGFGGPHASSPDEGHVCLYYGERADAFAQAFNRIGHCFVNTGKE